MTSWRPPLALLTVVLACGPKNPDDPTDATTGPDASSEDSTPDPTTTDAPTTETGDPTSPGDTGTNDTLAHEGLCSPFKGDGEDCPPETVCCSEDPATLGGKVPNYFMPGVIDDRYGIPIFSANNNALSHWGYCIEVGGFTSPFPSGCPVPCNPTWPPDVAQEICGNTSVCCQFTEMDPDKDCVHDGTRWRAVTGHDIPMLTTWGSLHTTNQDPSGESCTVFAGGGGPGFDQQAFDDCVAELTVANQRGFCYAPDMCPCREDVCDMKNPDWVAKCK